MAGSGLPRAGVMPIQDAMYRPPNLTPDPNAMMTAQPAMQQLMQPAVQQQPMAQQPNIFGAASQGINQGITTAGMETMYRPATIAGTDLTQYTNPYENQVVNQRSRLNTRSSTANLMHLHLHLLPFPAY